MNKKKGQELDLPPTWEEMQAGRATAPIGKGWSMAELLASWQTNEKRARRTIIDQGWVCIGKRKEPSITGDTKTVPIYAPMK